MTRSSSYTGDDRFFAAEATGPRDEQQDASIVLCDTDRGTALLVVSDGVGGNSGGRIASQLVKKAAIQMWEDHQGELGEPLTELNKLCDRAHQLINAEGERRQLSPRATIVALYLTPQQAYWVHSGDSRLYHFRAGKLVKRTEDHSLLQVMLKQGLVKEEQMGEHPDQGLLIQALGGEQYRSPSEDSTEVAGSDAFLLCTDGFWERTEVSAMAEILFKNRSQAETKLRQSIERAVKRNGPSGDNVTVAIALPVSGTTGIIAPEARQGRSSKRWPTILLICVPVLAVFLGLSLFFTKARFTGTDTPQPNPTATTPPSTVPPTPSPAPTLKQTPSTPATSEREPARTQNGGPLGTRRKVSLVTM
jgi:serine/threonine protein phosphatase PrpC